MKKKKAAQKSAEELKAELAALEAEEAALKEAEFKAAMEEQQRKEDEAKAAKKQKENKDLLKGKQGIFDMQKWKDLYKRKFKASRIVVANFELNNGHHTTILAVVSQQGTFNYAGNTYIVDDTLKYWNMAFKEWAYDYHQNFTMPIKRKAPLNELNEAMQQTNMGNVGYATNPSTLKTFLTNNVIQSAIEAASITDFFKQVRLLVIVSAAASVIHMLLWMNKAGMFKGLTGG